MTALQAAAEGGRKAIGPMPGMAVKRWLEGLPYTWNHVATIAATVAEPRAFHGGREFAAWLGLVRRRNSTGRKTRLGGIGK